MSNLKIYPFGGVGEIGSNMTIFETSKHIVIIDYGILFPYEDFFDINYLIADSSQLDTNKELTLFITHGHEDHIGAISHLLTEYPQIKVISPSFASILIKAKLERRKINRKLTLYDENSQFEFDEFTLHPVHVTHSIPETFGFVFHSKEISTLFISDFKFDLNPSFEDIFNYKKIQKLFASSKKSLAMLDSTNILNPGKTLSESDLIEHLDQLIANKKRTFVTMFSSNIYRLKNLLELAKKNKKKITTIGRSLNFYLECAQEAKLLSLEDYPYIEFDAIQNYSSTDIIYVVTGSQGEHLGAARRIIKGDQKNINLNEDDQFIFSSKPIPGNEKKVYQLYNLLAQKNVSIIDYKTHTIHASGHPCQEDLKQLLEHISPDFYIPIHGETYFLRKHIDFIHHHFSQIETIYLNNFQGVEFKNDTFRLINFSPIDPHIIHGNDLIIEREKISERRKIANNGIIFITLNHKSQHIEITTKGLPTEFDSSLLKLKDLADYCAFVENKKRDHDYTIEQVRIKTRTFAKSILGYKPITLVHMV
ncbi:MAG: hypothetical protein CME66_06075 [Halobacteriovoraceae bacterium]|nr:hypothetical protein [Halobacteriovoraceae bacterium]